jgi:hypothetical protein
VIDGIMAREALKNGLRYENSHQFLKNEMVLFPSELFCSMPNQVTNNSYLLHRCAQSWQPKTKNQKLQLTLDKFHLLKTYKFITNIKRSLFRKENRLTQ